MSASLAKIMLKLSNFFFNAGLFVLLIFVSLCWALENVDIWVRYILLPFLASTTLLGCLFKFLAKRYATTENASEPTEENL